MVHIWLLITTFATFYTSSNVYGDHRIYELPVTEYKLGPKENYRQKSTAPVYELICDKTLQLVIFNIEECRNCSVKNVTDCSVSPEFFSLDVQCIPGQQETEFYFPPLKGIPYYSKASFKFGKPIYKGCDAVGNKARYGNRAFSHHHRRKVSRSDSTETGNYINLKTPIKTKKMLYEIVPWWGNNMPSSNIEDY